MYDLRSETDNQKLVDEIADDWTTSSISPVQMAMCEFAKKLTENPNKVNQKDIDLLRSYDLSDKDISIDNIRKNDVFDYNLELKNLDILFKKIENDN